MAQRSGRDLSHLVGGGVNSSRTGDIAGGEHAPPAGGHPFVGSSVLSTV